MNRPVQRDITIGDRPINLTQLLKLAGCMQSGGEAKAQIAGGRIRVNGEVELRKRRQMTPGDRVALDDGTTIVLNSGRASEDCGERRASGAPSC
jgi:ribosome-associated protein